MKAWVTRNFNFNGCVNDIMVSIEKEPYREYNHWCRYNTICVLNKKTFKNMFGWTPKKGSCEQVELNIERKL